MSDLESIIQAMVDRAVAARVEPLVRQLEEERIRELAISETEAARRLSCSPGHLANLRIAGNGPAYCMVGARILYRPADIDEWLLTRRVRHTTEAEARERGRR